MFTFSNLFLCLSPFTQQISTRSLLDAGPTLGTTSAHVLRTFYGGKIKLPTPQLINPFLVQRGRDVHVSSNFPVTDIDKLKLRSTVAPALANLYIEFEGCYKNSIYNNSSYLFWFPLLFKSNQSDFLGRCLSWLHRSDTYRFSHRRVTLWRQTFGLSNELIKNYHRERLRKLSFITELFWQTKFLFWSLPPTQPHSFFRN